MNAARGQVKWVQPLAAGLIGLLEINGQPYTAIAVVDAGKVVSWRLLKHEGVLQYDLTVGKDAACDCLDFLYRRDGKDESGCKHIAALRVALAAIGILPEEGT